MEFYVSYSLRPCKEEEYPCSLNISSIFTYANCFDWLVVTSKPCNAMGAGKKQDLLPRWELEHWIPYNTQDISKVHCKLWKWQQQLSYLHCSRCRTSLMCSLYRWSQLWKVLACSYFLIPESRSFAALAKEGICTGMNLNINGKHKQFYIMKKHSVLKQMDFTAWTIAFHCLVLAKSKFLYDTKTIVGCWQAVILQEKSKWATTMLGILFSPENNALRSAWGQSSQNVMFYPRETLSMKNFTFPTGKSEKKPIKVLKRKHRVTFISTSGSSSITF